MLVLTCRSAMHESPLTEEISMQSSLDSRISMLLPPGPVLAQSAFALQKKKNQNPLAQINAFEVLVLDAL